MTKKFCFRYEVVVIVVGKMTKKLKNIFMKSREISIKSHMFANKSAIKLSGIEYYWIQVYISWVYARLKSQI